MLFRKRKVNQAAAGELPPLLLFHHIAKTAGTSLRKILQKNYRRRELLEPYGPGRASVEWYRAYYESMPLKQKTSVKCIAAHTAHYSIPVLDRPFQVFTLLRDPVDRVISLFYFAKSIAYTGHGRGAEIGREINRLGWGLEDVYLNLGEKSERNPLFDGFFDGQTRVILAPHFDVQEMAYRANWAMENDLWRQRLHALLDQHYVVGVQGHYRDSIQFFAQTFGWKKVFVQEKNKTKSRPRVEELPTDVTDLIRSYNQLDTDIYEHHSVQFRTRS